MGVSGWMVVDVSGWTVVVSDQCMCVDVFRVPACVLVGFIQMHNIIYTHIPTTLSLHAHAIAVEIIHKYTNRHARVHPNIDRTHTHTGSRECGGHRNGS